MKHNTVLSAYVVVFKLLNVWPYFRRGSGLSQRSIDNLKARLSRKMSHTSDISDASAQNISLDCEEVSVYRQDHYISSRRNSRDNHGEVGVITTSQLEELTLATYSVVTAGAALPHVDKDNLSTAQLKQSKSESTSNKHSSKMTRGSSRQSDNGRKSSCVSSRVASGKLQTPNTGYINGALTDDDLSDVSL